MGVFQPYLATLIFEVKGNLKLKKTIVTLIVIRNNNNDEVVKVRNGQSTQRIQIGVYGKIFLLQVKISLGGDTEN